VVVHAGADAIADQTAKRRAGKPGRDALAGSAAELRSDQTAGNRANERARILFRSLASLGSAGAGRDRQRGEPGSAHPNETHAFTPPEDPTPRPGRDPHRPLPAP